MIRGKYDDGELRKRTFKDHSIPKEWLVTDDGSPQYHLAFAAGVSGAQSRALMRDMEKVNRSLCSDAEEKRRQLEYLRERKTQQLENERVTGELSCLCQSLYALQARLDNKFRSLNAQSPVPALMPSSVPKTSHCQRLAALRTALGSPVDQDGHSPARRTLLFLTSSPRSSPERYRQDETRLVLKPTDRSDIEGSRVPSAHSVAVAAKNKLYETEVVRKANEHSRSRRKIHCTIVDAASLVT